MLEEEWFLLLAHQRLQDEQGSYTYQLVSHLWLCISIWYAYQSMAGWRPAPFVAFIAFFLWHGISYRVDFFKQIHLHFSEGESHANKSVDIVCHNEKCESKRASCKYGYECRIYPIPRTVTKSAFADHFRTPRIWCRCKATLCSFRSNVARHLIHQPITTTHL